MVLRTCGDPNNLVPEWLESMVDRWTTRLCTKESATCLVQCITHNNHGRCGKYNHLLHMYNQQPGHHQSHWFWWPHLVRRNLVAEKESHKITILHHSLSSIHMDYRHIHCKIENEPLNSALLFLKACQDKCLY